MTSQTSGGRSISLQNRRNFLRILGKQRQKRGEREARVAREGRSAKKSRLSPDHCSSSSAPRHTLTDQPITVLEKQWCDHGALWVKYFQGLVLIPKTEKFILLWDLI